MLRAGKTVKSEKKHVSIKVDTTNPSPKACSTEASPSSSTLKGKGSPMRKLTAIACHSEEALLLSHQELSVGDSFYSSGDYVNARLSYLQVISIITATSKVKLPYRGSPLQVNPSTKE